VVVDASVERHKNRVVAETFLDFVRSPEGQKILGEYGFRPLNAPLPEGVFTMKELGGWSQIKPLLYGPQGIWNNLFTNPRQRQRGTRRAG
jgi:sulfate transport system substrate-binding protein